MVIPTRHRPDVLLRAVDSALRQSWAQVEVVVVIDGPDETSVAALKTIASDRLVVLALPENVGGSEARNTGIRAARGEWIALLDDDDEWMPSKLEKQMALAESGRAAQPIVACSVVAQFNDSQQVWPRKAPAPPISEYLLARNSLHQGEGLLQTSTLLARRQLFLDVPFQKGLRKHQDWDWLLRVVAEPGVEVEFVGEALAVWHLEEDRNSVSRAQNWEVSLQWIRDRRALVTRRAYAGFIATQVVPQAARQRCWHAFWPLLREMFRVGSPRVIDVVLTLGMWAVPRNLRRRLHAQPVSSAPNLERSAA